MTDRIRQEVDLLRVRFPNLEFKEEVLWIRIPSYALPNGWNRTNSDVAFQIPIQFPGTPPYGIYVPAGLLFNGNSPVNYTDPAANNPPFDGSWAVFSWQPADGEWKPTSDPRTGSNLVNWVVGFAERFREGK